MIPALGGLYLADMRESLVPVSVEGVAVPADDELPVVLLAAAEGHVSLRVGAYEAGAIIMQLEGISPPRPLTHRLMAELMAEQGLKVERAELYGLDGYGEEGYLARIVYGKGLSRRVRDVRPSDAIALALAFEAPILAHDSLVKSAPGPLFMEAAEGGRAYWCRDAAAG